MVIKLKNDVVFIGYDDDIDMKNKILELLFTERTNKILHKGDPYDISYKLLKKIVPVNKKTLGKIKIDDYISNIQNPNVREIYNNFVKKTNCKYCLIYKT